MSREEALKRIRKEGCTAYWGMMKPGQGEESVKYVRQRELPVPFNNAGETGRGRKKTLPCLAA